MLHVHTALQLGNTSTPTRKACTRLAHRLVSSRWNTRSLTYNTRQRIRFNMVGPLKSSTNGGDEGGLSSSYPGKASGAFLSSLFRSKSRDSDKDTESSRQLSDSTPASSAPSLLPSHNGHPSGQGQHASAKPVKSTDSSSHWLLGRKPSEKKKDRPERLKNALFGHGSQSSGHASKEVKGAVKVSRNRDREDNDDVRLASDSIWLNVS